jgi:hypothetical protein
MQTQNLFVLIGKSHHQVVVVFSDCIYDLFFESPDSKFVAVIQDLAPSWLTGIDKPSLILDEL